MKVVKVLNFYFLKLENLIQVGLFVKKNCKLIIVVPKYQKYF